MDSYNPPSSSSRNLIFPDEVSSAIVYVMQTGDLTREYINNGDVIIRDYTGKQVDKSRVQPENIEDLRDLIDRQQNEQVEEDVKMREHMIYGDLMRRIRRANKY